MGHQADGAVLQRGRSIMKYNMEQRARLYNAAFLDYPTVQYSNGWLLGTWSDGNNYKGTGYYGSYPRSYLKRMRAIFPDAKKNRTLHLFSGSLDGYAKTGRIEAFTPIIFPGITLDINKELHPDVACDAHTMSSEIANSYWELILADCPYSEEDAKHYGTPLINRNKVVKECVKLLKPGGYLCWMDQVLPMYRKDELKRVGEISISRSTNHRVRAVFIFERV